MERVLPIPTRDERLAALRIGLKEANRVGLVRAHSAGGVSVADLDLQNVDLFEELRKRGELTVRMYMAFRLDPPRVTEEQFAAIARAKERNHDEWISAGAVKFFLDGVIESHTAAMLAPFSDDPKLAGSLLWDPKAYQQAVVKLDQSGVQVFTHAVGDRAIRVALDTYEEVAKANGTRDARHRIEHIETIAASDIPRFGKLGVIAGMQPLHAEPNDDTLLVWAKNVGPDRASRAWPWRSILRSGGVLGFGSDWPIVTQSPWAGIQNALTRETPDGKPEGGWIPRERIGLEEAIRGYTLGAAIAGQREKTEGSLEPGKVADLIVVSQDLFQIEPSDIVKTEELTTMVGGKIVYESPAWIAARTASEK
jgi:predicted amidohydrolase YtcJ